LTLKLALLTKSLFNTLTVKVSLELTNVPLKSEARFMTSLLSVRL
jgi:hypothetical protein